MYVEIIKACKFYRIHLYYLVNAEYTHSHSHTLPSILIYVHKVTWICSALQWNNDIIYWNDNIFNWEFDTYSGWDSKRAIEREREKHRIIKNKWVGGNLIWVKKKSIEMRLLMLLKWKMKTIAFARCNFHTHARTHI